MTVPVIAEHDHGSIKPATLNTVTAAAQCGATHVLIASHNAGGAARPPPSPASPKSSTPTAPASPATGENVAAQVLPSPRPATSCSRRPRTARTWRRAWPPR